MPQKWHQISLREAHHFQVLCSPCVSLWGCLSVCLRHTWTSWTYKSVTLLHFTHILVLLGFVNFFVSLRGKGCFFYFWTWFLSFSFSFFPHSVHSAKHCVAWELVKIQMQCMNRRLKWMCTKSSFLGANVQISRKKQSAHFCVCSCRLMCT